METLNDFFNKVKETAKANFTESINLDIGLKENCELLIQLPYGVKRHKNIMVLSHFTDLPASVAIKGGLDMIERIKKGENIIPANMKPRAKINGRIIADVCISTIDMMKNLSNIAKNLGKYGLFPNIKHGTIVNDVHALNILIDNILAGKHFVMKSNGKHLRLSIGKVDFSNEHLMSNLSYVIKLIRAHKPEIIQSLYLNASMGPSLQVPMRILKNI